MDFDDCGRARLLPSRATPPIQPVQERLGRSLALPGSCKLNETARGRAVRANCISSFRTSSYHSLTGSAPTLKVIRGAYRILAGIGGPLLFRYDNEDRETWIARVRNMRRLAFIMVAAFVVAVGVPCVAWAQVGGTSSGMFGGSRSMGQAMGGAASSAFGGSGFGMGSGLGSGMGSGLGSGMGSGLGSGIGSGYSSGLGTGSRSGSRVTPIGSIPSVSFRFTTRQPGDFVGADSRDARTGMLGGGTSSSASGYSSYGSTGYGSSQSTARSGTSAYRRSSSSGTYGAGYSGGQVTVGLDMAFDLNLPANPHLSSMVTERLAKSMRLSPGSPVAVKVQGDTAVLQGVVATQHDRALAEQLILLEPGVGRVTNELRVDPSGATVGKPPAPGNSP